MGLDMYAYTTRETLATAVDFPEPTRIKKLHYWRKHPNLHGWMQALYEAKGGIDPDFNCSAVQLDNGDLDRLEAAIKAGELPATEGFFFGTSYGSAEERNDDLGFIEKARKALASGKSVCYVAWW